LAIVAWWAMRPSGVCVEVVPVTRGTYVRELEEDGRARLRERYTIAAPVAGALERVSLEVGDTVEAGAVVARIRPEVPPLLDPRARAELEARRDAAASRVAAARAGLARAEAVRAEAEVELDRSLGLERIGAIPALEREHAELELAISSRDRDGAREGLRVAQHELDQARAAVRFVSGSGLEVIELRAPIGGRVVAVRQESERWVPAGHAILELGDDTQLEVVVDLLSADAARVRPGAQARLTGFGGRGELRGVVRSVEPVASVRISALGVEEERVDVRIDPVERDERWARVGDGYRVDVGIVIERIEGALRLPTSALFREGEAWRAFVLREGRARARRVELASYGPLESAAAEGVREGVREGERVVLEPPETLQDDAPVDARAPGLCGRGTPSFGGAEEDP
jgi:HlyD family secretion protein